MSKHPHVLLKEAKNKLSPENKYWNEYYKEELRWPEPKKNL